MTGCIRRSLPVFLPVCVVGACMLTSDVGVGMTQAVQTAENGVPWSVEHQDENATLASNLLAENESDLAVLGSLVQNLSEREITVVDDGQGACDVFTDCDCGCPEECCDCDEKKQLANVVKGAYKGLFFNNDFSYLSEPYYDDWHLGEHLKRRCLGDCIVYDVGGQFRLRYQNEHNIRGLGLTGLDDEFLLQRTRLYTNVEIGNRFRFYGEVIDAYSSLETLAPRPIEENRADILNLFVDGKLFQGSNGDVWARIGQQELLYGAQRLISPLDWANTRRTFLGGKVFWRGSDWDIDALWTRPIFPTAANVRTLNQADYSQEFSAIWGTYHGYKNQTIDLYFIKYLETSGATFDYNTFGGRSKGSRGDWLWELEGAFQYGNVGSVNNDAGFYTLGAGHKFSKVCWTPQFWAYFDWAKGQDAGPTGSAPTGRGFHQLFPLAHKYLGFMDLYGRRNIEDLNFLATLQPTAKLKLLAWWHILHMQAADVPYNVVMGPSASLSGGDFSLGQELDFTASWNVTPRLNLLLGYSHFFAGDFYSTNPSPGLFDGDADFYYTQLQLDF